MGYFDWVIYVAQSRLGELTDQARATLARDAFSYLHLPMVTGIVLFAFGLKSALGDSTRSLALVPAFGLVGGVAIYLLGHVGMRLRLGGGLGHGRPIASLVLLILVPVATLVPALVSLALVAAVCVALIAYEFFRYRTERGRIRSGRVGIDRGDTPRSSAKERHSTALR